MAKRGRPRIIRPIVSTTKKATSSEKIQETKNEPDEPLEEKHKEFRESVAETIEQPDTTEKVTLEQPIDVSDIPLNKPKIERDYTTAGIKNEQQDNGDSADSKDNQDTSQSFRTEKPKSEFKAEPPPADDPHYAPSQDTTADPTNADPDNPGFNIPTGSASDLVDYGAKSLNYVIGKFGGFLTDVKIISEFYLVEGIVPKVQAHNERSINALKLTKEEVDMLREPLVEIMNEKGIRGLTAGEKLLLASSIIIASKIKIFFEIKRQSKMLVSEIKELILESDTYSNRKKQKKERVKAEKEKLENEDIELSLAEEVEESHY